MIAARCGAAIVLATTLQGCSSEVVLANWACRRPSDSTIQLDAGTPLSVPWSTGFEDGFCGFYDGGGYCYSTGTGSHRIVESPVHSGRHAAALTVFGDGTDANSQARCVRRGELPEQAYYGAWFFVPAVPVNTGVWNLIHFQGSGGGTLLWDLSLADDGNAGMRLSIYSELPHENLPTLVQAPSIPIGSWFHVQLFLKRAADATGEVAVYQNGHNILRATNVITDDSQSAEWYVGNLATRLSPAESTLFVDDVSIGTGL